MEPFGYRKLLVYQKAKSLVLRIYSDLKKFPQEERYALCDQLRRASTSITSNIAEGMNRFSPKEKIHFLEISYTSLMEVSSQIDISTDLGYIDKDESRNLDYLMLEIARMLSGLQRSIKAEDDGVNNTNWLSYYQNYSKL